MAPSSSRIQSDVYQFLHNREAQTRGYQHDHYQKTRGIAVVGLSPS